MNELFRLKDLLIEIIQEAGNIMVEGQQKNIKIDSKSTINDLVTEYDVKVENHIISRIQETYPDHNIITEESDGYNENGEYTWIIDPIDGTVNYAHHIPFFCCSIGIMHNNNMILGAVFNPITKELFHAIKGHGSYLNDQPIHVSNQSSFTQSLLVTGFSYTATQSPFTFPLFEKIVGQNIPIRRLGSAALDLAYIACGRLDGFWEEGLKPWDIAAGYLLVREAGGIVTDFNGNSGDIYQKSTWASNGKIHESFLKTLHELGYKNEK